jgi:acetyl esterase/lipase
LDPDAVQEPQAYTYREVGGRSLQAHVFPAGKGTGTQARSAVLLFHGGGWYVGSPEWTFESAQRFASLGMVALSVEYRLSSDTITPIDALSDACAAFAWTRQNAGDLGIDPGRIAGYGVSAGGHLVAATATVGCGSTEVERALSRPDALLLWSPALDTTIDGWFHRLLQGRGRAEAYSPAHHVDAAVPPTSVVLGTEDTVTPLSGATLFCERVLQVGGICELNLYEGVGHLLTRNLEDQERDFDPDPEAEADGLAKHEEFLDELGFLRVR